MATGAGADDAAGVEDEDGFEKEGRLVRVCFSEGILSREAAPPPPPPPNAAAAAANELLVPPLLLASTAASFAGVVADAAAAAAGAAALPRPLVALLLLASDPTPPPATLLDPAAAAVLPEALTPEEGELDSRLCPAPAGPPAECFLEDDDDDDAAAATGGVPAPPDDGDGLPGLPAGAAADPAATRLPVLAEGRRPDVAVPAEEAISLARSGFWADRWNSDLRSRRFDTLVQKKEEG